MAARDVKSFAKAIPAPVRGWNARDSIDAMKEDEAIRLENWFPGFGKVSLRKGFTSYATDLGADVFTLAEFNAGAQRKFIAAAGGTIWDVSSAGSGVALASGYSSDKWQWAQFDDAAGGARMGLVNGTDAPQIYDGSGLTAMTISATGLTVSNLIGINVYKNRSYFWTGADQDFYYSATDALGGALSKFPLGRVSGFGGNLIAMGTWTVDGGDGVNDLAVFLMTSGDIVIYNGSDPSDANDWSLIGIFRTGPPLSIRSVTKVGSDLVVSTKDGYMPLSKILSLGRGQKTEALSDRIRGAISQALQDYGDNYGWQSILYPRGNMGIFNVPVSAAEFHQHVVNTETGAWCKFTGMNARCWGLYNDRLYFGGSGAVYLADEGMADDTTPIRGDAQPAWNYLGDRSKLKLVTALRVQGSSSGSTSYSASVGADFVDPAVEAGVSVPGVVGGDWDTSSWDTTDWPSETLPFSDWLSQGAFGYCFSPRVKVETSDQSLDWYAFTYLFEPGGVI